MSRSRQLREGKEVDGIYVLDMGQTVGRRLGSAGEVHFLVVSFTHLRLAR
jgi:hypothetical protein